MAAVEKLADVSASSKPIANRLSIGHLLLWITTTAASIAVMRPDNLARNLAPSDLEARHYYLFRDLMLVGVAPFLGAGLAGLSLGIVGAFRGGLAFPSQPGHWLLCAVGFVTFVVLVGLVLARITKPGPVSEFLEFLIPVSLILSAVGTGLVLYWVAFREEYPWRWKLALRIVGATLVLVFLCGFCMPLHGPWWWMIPAVCANFAAPILVLTASMRDLALRTGYDLFHWTGVFTFEAVAAIWFGLFWLGL